MQKSSEVKHPPGNRYTKTYDWQLKLLAPMGKTREVGAKILTFFEYWYNSECERLNTKDFKKIPLKFALSYIRTSLLEQASKNTITKALEFLDQEKLVLWGKGGNGEKSTFYFNVNRINRQAELFTKGQQFEYVHLFKLEPSNGSNLNRQRVKLEPFNGSNLSHIKEIIKKEERNNKRNTHKGERGFSLKNFFSDSLLSDWEDWKKHLSENHRMSYSETGEKHAIKNLIELSGGKTQVAKSIISYSIGGGWKTLCIKNSSKKSSAKKMPDTWNKKYHDSLKETEKIHEYYRHLKKMGFVKKNSPVGIYFEKKEVA